MKLNSCIKIQKKNVVLVPYRRSHVLKYHKWMESEQLREQTASERLSLQEEYNMQQTWLNDENKCTFIVLDTQSLVQSNDEVRSMIGDANLYIKYTEEGLLGEVGVMIADLNFRSKGLGKEATLALLRYGVTELKINKFQAIISMTNEVSISMFKKLNFQIESESAVFNEITLTRLVDHNWLQWLLQETTDYEIFPTEPNE